MQHLDFEQQVIELDGKISELRHMSAHEGINILEEISNLQSKRDKILKQIYSKLTPWQKVLVSRHPNRPHFKNYIQALVEDFTELSGDRLYAEDRAIVGGIGRFRGQTVMIMGHEKGHDIETRVRHNFGMAKPEGYRKVQRLMKLADQYDIPVITLVDTAGAYPGIGAEERGQAEAIARCMEIGLSLTVPFITAVIGEGGSGGAVAMATANYIIMLEHAIYSVISPEGCASILWRSAEQKQLAAAAQKLTAQDLLGLKVIDEVVREPLGGAQREPKVAIENLGNALEKQLSKLIKMGRKELAAQKRAKFLNMGRIL
jgi:acetyl-CoA carboxylase carboxyl transferase subunit alpha